MPTRYLSLTIGAYVLPRVVFADSPWLRLRGWYGYGKYEISGVLLQHCQLIHTSALHLSLDLIWLDAGYRCVGGTSNVGPWQICRHASARHVLELPSGEVDIAQVQSQMLRGAPFV